MKKQKSPTKNKNNKQNNSCFKILAKDKQTKARTGIIKTKSGNIETPFFMPVATKTAVKHISSLELKEMNCNAVISNTFILHLRPGESFIKQLGGIKKFMNFKGINVTDSGGFQMYSPSLYIKSDERGVYFKDPFENKTIFITPEKDMQIQIDLDSDIAMCLDTMPLMEHSKSQVKLAIERTTQWAERCKKEHDLLQKSKTKNKKQLLWGIIQGGIHEDLRKQSSNDLVKLNFDGYSIGGLALGESIEQEMKMVETCKKIIPENKPVYLMGAGNPIELLQAISRGVDMFDSRFPTQNARHATILTSQGKLRLDRKIYEKDSSPLDKNCKCKVCKNFSRAYIRYQLKQQEAVGMYLATYHNLFYLQDLMLQARKAIKQRKFKQLLDKVKKTYEKADRNVKVK
ncbi:tRNA guanosine(34) transglycosylase Tgt [Candidatus Pacearchaeota archaeon]|nr:tRNA guanosine(34) transglycosylase Tgt [Candidatus Pacearchaeota archaeon]